MSIKKYVPHNLRGKIMYGLKFLPDNLYIRLFFWVATGRHLNLHHPRTFEDKQQWLKLHNKHPEYSALVDKIEVREHIKRMLGEEYLIPILGKWERFEEIDFSKLPEEFVLKCNHDSGSVRRIEKKSALSAEKISNLRVFYNERVRKNFYWAGREYPYKEVKPHIFAEPLLVSDIGDGSLPDYKFFCFNGEPKLVQMMTNRKTDFRIDWFDMDFHHMPIKSEYPNADVIYEKPASFEEMKRIASVLSKGICFVRIDLYDHNGKIYFGEYTFFHGGGFQFLQPDEWEYKLGDWIDLSSTAQ